MRHGGRKAAHPGWLWDEDLEADKSIWGQSVQVMFTTEPGLAV